jgi:hypothetical protein
MTVGRAVWTWWQFAPGNRTLVHPSVAFLGFSEAAV